MGNPSCCYYFIVPATKHERWCESSVITRVYNNARKYVSSRFFSANQHHVAIGKVAQTSHLLLSWLSQARFMEGCLLIMISLILKSALDRHHGSVLRPLTFSHTCRRTSKQMSFCASFAQGGFCTSQLLVCFQARSGIGGGGGLNLLVLPKTR